MAVVWQWREETAQELGRTIRRRLEQGEVAALPTETFYALAAHPFRGEALDRLFRLKGRPPEKPVLLLVSGQDMVSSVAEAVPAAAAELIKRFWPGPLTLIFPARPGLSPLLTGGGLGVGLRQPRQSVTCRLIAALGFPLTGTSANRAGKPPLTRAEEVEREFGGELALILDAGPCPGGLPSTVVDLSVSPPRVVREGAVALSEIQQIIPDLIRGR